MMAVFSDPESMRNFFEAQNPQNHRVPGDSSRDLFGMVKT